MDDVRLASDDLLVVLTGAGISAESGIKTFRDSDGLWENSRIEDVATPEAFERNPRLVLQFYDQRRRQLRDVGPNPAHDALADLERRLGPERFLLVTQNVDDLHERAGSRNLIHMHGELTKVRCLNCANILAWEGDLLIRCPPPGERGSASPRSPQRSQIRDPVVSASTADSARSAVNEFTRCRCGGILRPHIVWFGEIPFAMERIGAALRRCSHFLAVGTSGVVYPAAGFLEVAKSAGAATFGINLEPPENGDLFDHFFQGKAGEMVPEFDRAIKT